MGYYTNFKLTTNVDIADKLNDYFDTAENNGYWGSFDNFSGPWTLHGVKWYEHEQDMRVLSAAFPDVVFTLHGEGEEQPDLWVEYYLGGKMQREEAAISYAPFDESKLQ